MAEPEAMKTSTICRPLDQLLEGGLEPGAITLLYGVPATGKTNLCLQAARSVVQQGLKVAYVDTEGVSFDRLRQIAGDDYQKMMSQVLFSSPRDLRDQERLVKQAAQIPEAGLIVVDSLNFYYRLELDDDAQAASRSMLAQLGSLQAACRSNRIPCLVTAQVYESSDEVLPFGGRTMGHIVKTIVELQRGGEGPLASAAAKHGRRAPEPIAGFSRADEDLDATPVDREVPGRMLGAGGSERVAVLRKHRAIPEGKSVRFRITDKGLE